MTSRTTHILIAAALGMSACTSNTNGPGPAASPTTDAAMGSPATSTGGMDASVAQSNGSGPAASPTTDAAVGGAATSTGGMDASQPDTSASGLSKLEIEGVVFTREEEKLARDVYAALAHWDNTFVNIGRSEQTHMDAVKVLLDTYGLPDPADGLPPGAFENPQLQALHDQLVAEGSISLEDALKVGLSIEELDIRDIEAAMEDVTHADILATYANLLKGSRNHLRAFSRRLAAIGGTYTPQYLTAAEFDAVASSPTERGPKGG